MKYIQTFVVQGSLPFPVDMLRYDSCYPKTTEDAMQIVSRDLLGTKTVTLQRQVDYKKDQPTVDRWRSFGWLVTLVQTNKY